MLGLKLGCFSAAQWDVRGGEGFKTWWPVCELSMFGNVSRRWVRTQFVDELLPSPRLRVPFHATHELARRRHPVGLRFVHLAFEGETEKENHQRPPAQEDNAQTTRGEREPLCFELGKHACLESSHYPRYERDVGLFDEYPRNPASESRGDSVCSFNKINRPVEKKGKGKRGCEKKDACVATKRLIRPPTMIQTQLRHSSRSSQMTSLLELRVIKRQRRQKGEKRKLQDQMSSAGSES